VKPVRTDYCDQAYKEHIIIAGFFFLKACIFTFLPIFNSVQRITNIEMTFLIPAGNHESRAGLDAFYAGC
jgi:hypothetical protein